jgi:hypothetical protein
VKIILNKKIIFLIISVVLISFSNTVIADWDGLPFTPGAIDNPPCLPSQSNCDVLPSVTTELDPVYSSSNWFTTTNNSSNWNTAYSWGNHVSMGYITGTPWTSVGYYIGDGSAFATAAQGSLANTAVQGTPWTSQGYLTSYTETDPTFTAWNKSTGISITESQISDLKNYLTSYTETDPIYSASNWFTTTNNSTNWDTSYGWGDHANAGYLNSTTGLKLDQTTPQTTVGRFTFSSLTVDTNTLYVDSVNHRIGIGTTSPLYSLDILSSNPILRLKSSIVNTDAALQLLENSTLGAEIRYTGGGSNNLQFNIDSGSGMVTKAELDRDTGIMSVLNGINIGVGTAGQKLFQIGHTTTGDGMLFNNTSGVAGSYSLISFRNTTAATGNQKGGIAFERTGSAGVGKLQFITTSNTTSANIALIDSKMVLDSAGNVGIGTTNPGQLLHVKNNASSYAAIDIQGNQTGDIEWLMMSGYPAAGNFTIREAGVQNSLTILKTSGNVGIGTTSPTEKLHIVGSGSARILVDDGSGNQFKFGSISTNGFASEVSNLPFYFGTNNTNRWGVSAAGGFSFGSDYYNVDPGINNMIIKGNVGIGTTAPWSKLNVLGASSDPSLVRGANSILSLSTGSGTELAFTNNSAVSPYTFSLQVKNVPGGSGDVAFPLALNPLGGNVGIGTTSPSYKLDIKGTAITDGVRSDMGFDIYQVPAPNAPTGVVSSGGSVDTGDHYYRVSYTTAVGETTATVSSIITTTAGNNTVTLTIPVSTDPRVTGRKIYRTKAGTAHYTDFLLTTIANNTATSYIDITADSGLTGTSGMGYFRMNTTTNMLSLNGTKILTISGTNVFLGKTTGTAVTTGGDNTFMGDQAGYHITTGNQNAIYGSYAAPNATTVGSTSAFGYASLAGITTGNSNTALGTSSLQKLTTGAHNVGIGFNAGSYIADGTTSNTTSDYSLYIGRDSKASVDDNQNEIVIGYNAIGNGSNSVTLGNDSITKTILKGSVGIGTTNPGLKLDVQTPGYGFPAISGSTQTYGGLRISPPSASGNVVLDTGVNGGATPLAWFQSTNRNDLSLTYPLLLNPNGGNVGIGTTTPGYKLDIAGDINISSGNIYRVNGLAVLASDSTNINFGSASSARNLNFYTGNVNPSFYIASSGNIGIGTTSMSGNFQVDQRTSGVGTISVSAGGTVVTGTGTQFLNTFKTGDNIIANGETHAISSVASDTVLNTTASPWTNAFSGVYTLAGGNILTALGNARVGIGTTTPVQALDVNGRIKFKDYFEAYYGTTLSGRFGSSYWLTTPGGTQDASLTAYNNIYFSPGNTTTPNTILSTAGMGIGMNTAPTARLDVRGTTASQGIRSAMGFDIYPVPDPTAPTGVVSAGGSVDTGAHWYGVTYTTAIGSTHIVYTAAQITTTSGNNTVTLTIPVSTDPRVTGRKIYRAKAGEARYVEYLLATISNNTDTTYIDTIADSALTGSPGLVYFKPNTTSKNITVGGVTAMTIDSQATYFGIDAGASVTVGGRNTFIGSSAGSSVTSANDNVLIGFQAGSGINGSGNVKLGAAAGQYTGASGLSVNVGYHASTNSSGDSNVFVGYFSGYNSSAKTGVTYNTALGTNALQLINTNSTYNTAIGYRAGYNSVAGLTGGYNTLLGAFTGSSLTTGVNNIFIGNTAGRYETGSNSLIIDSLDRGTEALGRTSPLIYGITNTTPASQILSLGGGGKVGIGTTSPTQKLDIVGGIIKAGSGDAYNALILQDGLGNNMFRGIRVSAYWNDGANSTAFQVGGAGDNIVFTTYTSGVAPRILMHTNGFHINNTYPVAAPIGMLDVSNGATKLFNVLSTGNVGVGTSSPSTKLEIGSSDLGDGIAGPVLTLGRNTNATNPGAGSLNFLSNAGTAGYVWQDAGGNIRINTSAPTTINDTAGTVVGAQTSERSTKQDINDYTDYNNALSMVINAPLHTFRYIKEVNGYGENSPLTKTRIGYIADEVDPIFMVGNVIDQVSLNGILMASIKAMDLKIVSISDMSIENNWRNSLISWFANTANGITEFVASTLRAKDKLCIGEGSEEVCITKQELLQMKNNINKTEVVNPVIPEITPVVSEPTPVVVEPVIEQENIDSQVEPIQEEKPVIIEEVREPVVNSNEKL